MTTEKMNVHKAMIELKTLNSRIESAVARVQFVLSNKHSNEKINGTPVSRVIQDIKDSYQSVVDLIKRRNAIKRAVIRSNNETMVTICGVEYTVAEAIDMKNNGLKGDVLLLSKLSMDYSSAKRKAEVENSTLDSRADAYIKSLYENADMKNLSDEIQKMRQDFVSGQAVELVDPLDAKKLIDRLDAEIDSFKVEVDAALSVSNAVTEITVEY